MATKTKTKAPANATAALADSVPFETGVRILQKVAPAASLFLSPLPNNKGSLLTSNSNGNIGQFLLPSVIIDGLNVPIEMTSDSLLKAMKGRSDIRIKYVSGALTFKSKNYDATVMTAEVSELPQIDLEADKETSQKLILNEDTWAWVSEAINGCKVSKTGTSSAEQVFAYVKITEKGGFAVVYSHAHMAFKFDKNIKGDVKLFLPLETALLVIKELPSIKAKIAITEQSVTFVNANMKAQIALLGEDVNRIDPQSVYKMCLDSPKEKGVQLNLDTKSLVAFRDNAEAIQTVGTRAHFLAEKGATSVKVSITSTNGTVNSSIKLHEATSKAIDAKFDSRFIPEITNRASEDESVLINFVPEKFLIYAKDGINYVAGLSGEE